MKKHLITAAVALTLLTPLLVSAQTIGGINPVPPAPETTNIATIMTTVLNWAFGLLIVLAALFIIWAAFLYLTSGGDSEKTEKATKFIVFAVVAIVVAALARAVVFIVRQIVGVA